MINNTCLKYLIITIFSLIIITIIGHLLMLLFLYISNSTELLLITYKQVRLDEISYFITENFKHI